MPGKIFFDSIRASLFDGAISQTQVNGVTAIMSAWAVQGDGELRHLAYVLATALRETASTMQPIREYGKGKDHPYGRIDATGKAPYGRGYVQLTWGDNYRKADAKLGLDGRLAKDYDLALDPTIAAGILIQGMLEGWFTGKKLSDYTNDFVNARRIINGTDKAALIAGYANKFLAALTADAAAPVAQPAPVPVAVPPATPVPSAAAPVPSAAAPMPPPAPTPVPPSLWVLLLQFVLSLFKRKA